MGEAEDRDISAEGDEAEGVVALKLVVGINTTTLVEIRLHYVGEDQNPSRDGVREEGAGEGSPIQGEISPEHGYTANDVDRQIQICATFLRCHAPIVTTILTWHLGLYWIGPDVNSSWS